MSNSNRLEFTRQEFSEEKPLTEDEKKHLTEVARWLAERHSTVDLLFLSKEILGVAIGIRSKGDER